MGVAGAAAQADLPLVRCKLTVGGADLGWRVRKLDLREDVFDLYDCTVDLVNEELDADIAGLAGASCELSIERGPSVRRLLGLVTRVEWLGTVTDRLTIRVRVRPALAALAQNRDSRIFQEESVKEILEQVLTEGLKPYRRTVQLKLLREYNPREYCVQYAESDLDFALRLMAEEGIFFFFDHSGEREVLVLVDQNQSCPQHQPMDGSAVPVMGPQRVDHLVACETIERLEAGRQMCSTGSVVRDYDWTRPVLDLTFARHAPDARNLERNVYEFPTPQIVEMFEGSKTYPNDEGLLRAQLRQEALQAGASFAVGESNVTGLSAGMMLDVEGQLLTQGTRYLVTRVEHGGETMADGEQSAGDAGHNLARTALSEVHRYRNRFTCVPVDLPYRPAPRSRPVIPGAQTALVVGPGGEEIHTDQHARIKVQFHWDREGQRNDRSSCWVRVMQTWAGGGFGSLFIPRIGMEVVVQFLDGNPDRPLVVGCVYNGANPPGIGLPDGKTRSSIITQSSPGGSGYNELTFEDAAGREEISVHAQKDMNIKILNDRSSNIGHDETASVANDQQLSVGNNRQRQVGNDESVSVGNNQQVSIGNNQQLSVGNDQTGSVGNNRTTSVGSNDATTVGADSTLSVGSNQSIQVGSNRTLAVGSSDSTTVGASSDLTVGGSQSIKVGSSQSVSVSAVKTETVGGLSAETVGGAKTLTVGGALAITVGAAMNTAVAGACLEQIGMVKIVNAGSKIELSCGSAKIVMESGGKITVEGTELNLVSSGPVNVKGSIANLN